MSRNDKQKTLTVLLADDHPIVRQGLKTLLENAREFKLVGEAGDGLELMRLAERLQPDVLILDLMMPGINGLEAIAAVKKRSGDTQILVFSMYSTASFVVAALHKGATGYVPKGCESQIILRGLRKTAAGQRFLGPPVSEKEIEKLLQESPEYQVIGKEDLTPRERQVLHLAAEGHTNREIGTQLHISSRTVEMYRANVMRKLGLHSSGDLVRYAVRLGIIPLKE